MTCSLWVVAGVLAVLFLVLAWWPPGAIMIVIVSVLALWWTVTSWGEYEINQYLDRREGGQDRSRSDVARTPDGVSGE